MNVEFWNSFSKRANSTLRPAGAATAVFDCKLKDSSGILHPVLEIYNTGSTWNPSALNYARITAFDRYYYVSEWTWIVGRWECRLDVDAMASYKSTIGSQYKYVLRAAADWTPSAVDTFYPALAKPMTSSYSTASFWMTQNYGSGTYILGVANRAAAGAGAVSYYIMTSAQIRALVQDMLVSPVDTWQQGFTAMTDVLYRSLYDPFAYIKSCKWFPITISNPGSLVSIEFGNYVSSAQGAFLVNDTTQWGSEGHDISLPAGWSSLEGKYKSGPYCHMYLIFNPFGVIELNPMDFADASAVRVVLTYDFISGDAMITISKVVSNVAYFITQAITKIATDINLSSSSIDASALIGGALGIAAGAISLATGGAGAPAAIGAISLAGSVGDVLSSSVPSASGSVGQTTGGARMVDGSCTLMITTTQFADEALLEFGKPLFQSKILNTLSGYIKCADGEFDSDAFPEEREIISGYLTSGFFYE